MRITESKLRRIIRQVISESLPQFHGRRFGEYQPDPWEYEDLGPEINEPEERSEDDHEIDKELPQFHDSKFGGYQPDPWEYKNFEE